MSVVMYAVKEALAAAEFRAGFKTCKSVVELKIGSTETELRSWLKVAFQEGKLKSVPALTPPLPTNPLVALGIYRSLLLETEPVLPIETAEKLRQQ